MSATKPTAAAAVFELVATSVSGKLYRSAPGETNKVTFDFPVTFKAPIQRKR